MEAQLGSYHTAVSFNTSCSDFTSFYFSPPCSPGLVTAPIQRSKKGQAEDILQSMGLRTNLQRTRAPGRGQTLQEGRWVQKCGCLGSRHSNSEFLKIPGNNDSKSRKHTETSHCASTFFLGGGLSGISNWSNLPIFQRSLSGGAMSWEAV